MHLLRDFLNFTIRLSFIANQTSFRLIVIISAITATSITTATTKSTATSTFNAASTAATHPATLTQNGSQSQNVISKTEISNHIESENDNEKLSLLGECDFVSDMKALPTVSTVINVTDYPGELCNRICVADDVRICYFKFVLEHYQAMGVVCGDCGRGNDTDCDNEQCIVGDGVEKGVMSINRRVPGPAIQVCHNDTIIVDVANRALGTAAAMHWHGVHLYETPYMDGVPMVTQCPIPFATIFRYQFKATEVGTLFYHSHSGHHKVNGQYGALIVREPAASVPNADLYDFDLPEHYILISDWMHDYGEQHFPGLPSSIGIFPDAVLINGRGVYTSPFTGVRTTVPPTRYYVTPGKRYRFRLINSISNSCPFKLQIEKHNMSIIASDSYNLDPAGFDTLVSNAGERYDIVLTANYSSGDYWIRVRGMGLCVATPIESFALLRYKSNDPTDDDDETRPLPPMPAYEDEFPMGMVLNYPNASCFGENDHCITELTALEEDVVLRNSTPDQKFFLAFHNYPVPNEEIFRSGRYDHFANLFSNMTIVGAINNLSLIFPPYPPLTQPNDIKDDYFCNDGQRPAECAGNRLCPCAHRLQVPLGSIVELIIVDASEMVGRMHHPFHLHGYRFMVTGLGHNPLGVPMSAVKAREMEENNLLPRNETNPRPPFKDTVSIPSFGYAVVRFRADNPGFWLMHCHYEWHLSIGMGLILQVGNISDMLPPPVDFPTCGNYLPEVQVPAA